jgi:5-methylcytosine-specific restriction endonuclease McrA
MLRREELRMMSRHRYSRVKQAGGSFTKKDVAELLEVQEGLCYFCGGHINTGSRKDNLHADHYDPIANGGKNEVFNIVLTCPSCNITKGAMHGDRFEQIVKKTRDPDIGRNLGRIRSKLTRYRAQRRAATSHD